MPVGAYAGAKYKKGGGAVHARPGNWRTCAFKEHFVGRGPKRVGRVAQRAVIGRERGTRERTREKTKGEEGLSERETGGAAGRSA